MSGLYELAPVGLSSRRRNVDFPDAIIESMSAQRHIEKLNSPIVLSYGTFETPEFQRQSRDFAAAVRAAGKPVQLIAAPSYTHATNLEALGNPYGHNGRAALALMKLAPA